MGVGVVHGKNSESQHTANRGGVLSGHPNTGPSPVGVPTGLKARITMSPRNKVLRGDTVTLSAKHSSGFVKSFSWTFSYADDSDNDTIDTFQQKVPPLKECTKQGTDISVVVLRSLNVKLTVTDTENNTDSDRAVIEVAPRRWRTDFVSHPTIKPMSGMFRSNPDTYVIGMNNCTFEGVPKDGEGAGHILHRAKKDKPQDPDDPDSKAVYGYEDEKLGFSVGQVSDPGGPFHGFWYVRSYNVKIDRTLFVNEKLMPGGNIYELNHTVHKYAKDMDTLLKGVSKHEQIHSDVFHEILKEVDPGPKLEDYVLDDADDLRLIVNIACTEANSALEKDQCHEEKVHERLRKLGFDHPGTILLADGSEFAVKSFANLGDGGSD